MRPLDYNGIAYRQSRDPQASWLVSIVVPAEELLRWAGIPRRTEGHEIGFQRTEKPERVAKAKDFFQESGKNQSPTALVVGVHPVPVGTEPKISLEFLDGTDESPIRACRLHVGLEFESDTIGTITDRLKAQVSMRLAEAGDIAVQDVEDETLEGVESNEAGGEESDEEADDDVESDGDIELGRSLLGEFLEKLHNPVWCEENEEDLREIAKPATVIDGQHRVLGAAACERNLPFTCCVIYNCEWAEQVFQFTVVNYTAKGIPDQFITANAALSLTSGELTSLESRLVQAGVKVTEYELMRVVNFTDSSPFFDMVNLTESKKPDKIGYKTMVRVAKTWYEARNHGVKKVLKQLYPDISGKKAAARRLARWQDGDWGDFFLAFWAVVKEKYAPARSENGVGLWEVGSNLLIAIVLFELQERYMIYLNAADEAFFAVPPGLDPKTYLVGAVSKRAKVYVGFIPSDFFAIHWATKSLSISSGRDVLKAALRELVESSGSFSYKRSRLVTGVS